MGESAAWVVVGIVGVYLGVGGLFAGPFVTLGVQRIDPVAREGTWGFRLLIVPGTILLWPLLAHRWRAGSVHPPVEMTAHRRHPHALRRPS